VSTLEFDQFYWFAAAAIFAAGLVFGSFLNVCIHRLPRGLSVVRPRSACPQCKAPITALENIPLLSWLWLRGRCRHCRAAISFRYPAVELLTGVLFLACFWRFGFSLETLKFCTFSFLLLGLIFTDAEHKLLPDLLTLPGVVLGLAFSLFVPVDNFASSLLPDSLWTPLASSVSWRLQSLLDSSVGALVGASFLYGVALAYLRFRGIEGMGMGDVKLMALIGAFLGTRLTILTLFFATLAASLVGVGTMLAVWIKRTRRRTARQRESSAQARRRAWRSAQLVFRGYEMPFGAYLASMAVIALFFGNAFIRWYGAFYQ
jgi:leader peptidase (prepilin peptidase) / N-methyltransferase